MWSVNHQDNVAAIVSDLDAGIVYIGGHTFDVTGTSSALFVAQFTSIISSSALSYLLSYFLFFCTYIFLFIVLDGNLSIAPKTFVYRLPFPEDTASSPTMFGILI